MSAEERKPRNSQAEEKKRRDPHAIPDDLLGDVKAYVEKAKSNPPNYFCECSELHPGSSCIMFTLKRIFVGFLPMLKVYAPIHFIPLLIFRRKELLKRYGTLCLHAMNFLTRSRPIPLLKHTAFATLKSTIFLVMFTTHFMGTVCLHRNLTKKDSAGAPLLGGILAGLSLFWEKQVRSFPLCFSQSLTCVCASPSVWDHVPCVVSRDALS